MDFGPEGWLAQHPGMPESTLDRSASTLRDLEMTRWIAAPRQELRLRRAR